MKQLALFKLVGSMVLLCFVSKAVNAQTHDGPIHELVMNDTWRAINTLVNQQPSDGSARFSPAFEALQNKKVNLAGCVIPIESGLSHKRFMLSLLPIMQCMFCGQNGIPPMVEVIMDNNAVAFTDFPIEIVGRLQLTSNADGSVTVQILEAELYQ